MSTRFWIGIATAIVSASPILAGQSEIHACVHKNTGALRIVASAASCNPNNETPLTWNTSGPPQPAAGFRVLDSNDALVGPLVDFDHVLRLIDGHWFAPGVTKSGFVEAGISYLYESTDCTGQAYLQYDDRIPEASGSSLGGGSTLTIYYPAPPITPRTIQSSRSVFSTGAAQPCLGPLGFIGVQVGIPTSATITASPPFRLVD